MKLKIEKIIEILVKIKDDVFYFKNYAPEIIESYTNEFSIDFAEWLRENCYDTGNNWLYQKDDELYTSKEIYDVYKKERSETVA